MGKLRLTFPAHMLKLSITTLTKEKQMNVNQIELTRTTRVEGNTDAYHINSSLTNTLPALAMSKWSMMRNGRYTVCLAWMKNAIYILRKKPEIVQNGVVNDTAFLSN